MLIEENVHEMSNIGTEAVKLAYRGAEEATTARVELFWEYAAIFRYSGVYTVQFLAKRRTPLYRQGTR